MFGQAGRPGDWVCPGCHDLQFAQNTTCRKCKSMRPGSGPGGMMALQMGGVGLVTGGYGGGPQQVMLAGDWICSRCRDHQFARNVSCRRCGAPRDGMQNPTTASLFGGEGGFSAAATSGLSATAASGRTRTGFSDAQSSALPKRGFSDAPLSGFHDRISKFPSFSLPGDQPYDPLQPPSLGNGGAVETLLQEKLALHGVPPPPEGPPISEEKNSNGRTIFLWGPGANIEGGSLAGIAERSRSRSDRKQGRKESRSSSRSQAKRKKKSRKADKKSSKSSESKNSPGSGSSSEDDDASASTRGNKKKKSKKARDDSSKSTSKSSSSRAKKKKKKRKS